MRNSHNEEGLWAILALSRFSLAAIVGFGHLGLFVPAEGWLATIREVDGKAAVIGFLMISGYSIHASLDRSPTGFLWRRLLRVYPLYLISVAFTVWVEFSLGGAVELRSGQLKSLGPWVAIGNVLMLQMFLVKAIAFNGPLWSLSIEFSFYAIAAKIQRHPVFFLALGLLSVLVFILPRNDSLGAAYSILTRLNWLAYFWPWLLGFWMWGNPGWRASAAAAGGAFAIAFDSAHFSGAYATITCLAAYLVVLFASRIRVPHAFVRTFDALGGISYPLYLFHFPLWIWMYGCGFRGEVWEYIFAVLVASALLHFLVEGYLVKRFLKPLVRL